MIVLRGMLMCGKKDDVGRGNLEYCHLILIQEEGRERKGFFDCVVKW